jgi:hypothetical protein
MRSRVLQIRLSPEEFDLVRRDALRTGMSSSAWARKLLMGQVWKRFQLTKLVKSKPRLSPLSVREFP